MMETQKKIAIKGGEFLIRDTEATKYLFRKNGRKSKK